MAVGAPVVAVACGLPPEPRLMITVSASPKKVPAASAMRQVPLTVPVPVEGAVILGMEQVRFDGYADRDSIVRTAKELVK